MAEDVKKPSENNDLPKTGEAAQGSGTGASGAPAASAAAAPAAQSAARAPVSNFDGGAISDRVQVIVVTPASDSARKLVERWASDASIVVHEATSTEAPAIARRLVPCMVIGSIAQSTDIVKQLSMLKLLGADVKKNRIKCLMLSKIKNASIVKTFEELGCHEYIVEPIPDRSLKFKVDLQTKAIGAQRRQMRRAELAKFEAARADGAEKKKGPGAKDLVDDKQLDLKKGDEKEGEVFVFRGNKVKKEGKKWTMRMKGPDPKNGDWLPMKKGEDGQTQWRYVEKGEDPTKPPKKGAYEFTGDKPEFTGGEWQFSGEKPKLAVVDENGKEKEAKVSADADGLNIGKDSKLPAWKVKDKFAEEKAGGAAGGAAGEAMEEKGGDKPGTDIPEGAGEGTGGGGLLGKKKTDEPDSKKRGSGMDLAGLAANFDETPEKYGDKSNEGGPAGPIGGKTDLKDAPPPPAPKWKGQELTPEESKWLGEEEARRKKEGQPPVGLMDLKRKRLDERKAKEAAELAAAKSAPPGRLAAAGKLDAMHGADLPDGDGEGMGGGGLLGAKKDKTQGALTPDPADPASGLKGRKPKSEAAAGGEKGNPLSKGKGALGSGEAAGEEDAAKNDAGALAGLAMDFTEEPESYKNKAGKDAAPAPTRDLLGQGKDEKGREGEASAAGSPPAIKDRKQALLEKKAALEDQQKKAKKAYAEEIALGKGKKEKSKEEAALGANGRNFLKDKDGGTKDFADKDDEPTGGRAIGDGEGSSGPKWGARDSDQSEEDDGEDKLVEVDGVSARMSVKDGADGPRFEYPATHFGDASGTWEATGTGDKDQSGRKLFIFVEPWIRTDRKRDVATIPRFWVYRSDERPLYVAKTKMWVFRSEPVAIDGFKKLSAVSQAFLLSISPQANGERRAEAAKAAAAEVAAKNGEAVEDKKKKEAGSDSSGPGLAPAKKGADSGASGASDPTKGGKDATAGDPGDGEPLSLFGKKKKDGEAASAAADAAAAGALKKKGEDDASESLNPFARKEKGAQKDGKAGAADPAKGGKDATAGDAAAEESLNPFAKKKKDGDAPSATAGSDSADGPKKKKGGDDTSESLSPFARKSKNGQNDAKAGAGEDKAGSSGDFSDRKDGETGHGLKGARKRNDGEISGASEGDGEPDGRKDKADSDLALDLKKRKDQKGDKADGGSADEPAAGLKKAKKGLGKADETAEAADGAFDDKSAASEDSDAPQGLEGKSGKGAESARSDAGGPLLKPAKAPAGEADAEAPPEAASESAGDHGLAPAQPGEEKGKVLRLPSGPMIAVVLSEILMFSKNGTDEALKKFFAFLSDRLGNSKLALYALEGKVGRLVASNDPALERGQELDFGMNELARDAIVKRQTMSTGGGTPGPEGAIYCPVLPPTAFAAMGPASGLLIIEPTIEAAHALRAQSRYLHGVAQCFRGLIIHTGRLVWNEPGKKAA